MFYFIFLFLFNCVGSFGDCAGRNLAPFIRSPLLYEPDHKIERTFHLWRKKQKCEEQRRKARRISPNMAIGGGDQRRMLRDFVTIGVQGIASSIARSNVKVNNFEFKPTLISMVQQS